ncbi:glucose-1-phosphate adenylyltransferase subunit GlgD [Tepidibacter formicigenes]|uniref:Glucose-1-phosphate adenylyltransferase n=1 Tax=Tepidibacter formicigenes DSM 15518 TaxID=1123349 RepID=A0A1M6SJC5_9FIRM|nr:glucose-1-phosphate adenylyltransferase subunit GlgD [Tepidibacter formicigenes]SHK44874.1 glucose-1-phosphate adenylyltransferase [Tepidibacter formicigenes DSM 15518]
MQDIMGIINLSEKEDAIKEITYNRPIATIPIAGRYRVIDFVLSNMVNAGIQNVSIFTQGKCRSLMQHLETGKEWDLNRKIDGLFVFNPVINSSDTILSKGDIKNFKDQMDYIKQSKQNYVLLSRSYMICNVDYIDAFKYYKESNADITILYKKVDTNNEKFLNCDTLNLNENGNVISIGKNVGNKDSYNISMEMYIMKKNLLLEMIENSISIGDNAYLKEAIHNNISNLNVNAYRFNGYLACINSIENYYKSSIELLDVDISEELFYKNGYIYTRVRDEAPTKYSNSSHVVNSFIANGCIIEGTVENSIIARGVKVKKGAIVKDSVIMQKCVVEEDTILKHVVLDKNVNISKNKVLCGDMKKPLVVKKNLNL